MRYLQENASTVDHGAWTGSCNLWLGAHFFWHAGAEIEKSLRGALLSLLYQLLSDHDWLIELVVHALRWTAASTSEQQAIWGATELEATLHASIRRLSMTWRILLLADGLDEIAGSEKERERAVNVFKDLTALPGVKVCASSRPWNLFEDAFKESPKLLLQDLTTEDINSYVRDELEPSLQFQYSFLRESGEVERLINTIIEKASSVFLWVKLVVEELCRGLRDGDSVRGLQRTIDNIPADLDEYFRRIVLSVDAQHRWEGAAALQTIMFAVSDSTTLWPQRLLDLYYLEEGDPCFALRPDFDFGDMFDPFNDDGIHYLINQVKRRLNSRCMCLLEAWPALPVPPNDSSKSERIFGPRVQFLRRPLHDFLHKSSAQQLLEGLTAGPFAARLFLCNALLIRAVTFGNMVRNSLNHAEKVRYTIKLAAMLDRTFTAAASLRQHPNLFSPQAWDRLLEITKPLFAKVFHCADRFHSEMGLITIMWESSDIYERSPMAKIVAMPHLYEDSMTKIARVYGYKKRRSDNDTTVQRKGKRRRDDHSLGLRPLDKKVCANGAGG